MTKTSVLVVDDHPVVRDGLCFLLESQSDFRVVGEVAMAAEVSAAVERFNPDVLLLDLNLQGRDQFDLVRQVSGRFPDLRILVLSMHSEEVYASRMLKMGADGYVMKQEEPTVFLRALRTVAKGGSYLSDAVKAQRELAGDNTVRLTAREMEVLQLIGQGLETSEIAAKLGMRFKTVETHRRNMRDKLGLSSPVELVRYAVSWSSDPADAN